MISVSWLTGRTSGLYKPVQFAPMVLFQNGGRKLKINQLTQVHLEK